MEETRLLETKSLDDSAEHIPKPSWQRPHRPICVLWAICPFLLSLSLNVLFLIYFALSSTPAEPTSAFAELQRSQVRPFYEKTPFASDNETLQARLWQDISIDAGVVALSDDFVDAHHLRRAQRFPWDQSKGIYLLHGYHNLHCLKIVYLSLHEYRHDMTQSRDWHHISHCMDALRLQILCDADDTPRATDRRAEKVTGLHQHRKCRSWDALEAFAHQHTACYQRPQSFDDEEPIIERFKHCPEGSNYVVFDGYESPDELLAGLPEESVILDISST